MQNMLKWWGEGMPQPCSLAAARVRLGGVAPSLVSMVGGGTRSQGSRGKSGGAGPGSPSIVAPMSGLGLPSGNLNFTVRGSRLSR